MPTFGHYSSANAGLNGPSTQSNFSGESYTISPSNTTAANSSYSLTYVNNFYQNAAYASTLIRAFDSYSSTDGGVTWTAPTSAKAAVAYRHRIATTSRAATYRCSSSGSTSTYATDVKDVVGSTTRNKWWELDGYSSYTNGTFRERDVGTERLYASTVLRLHAGAGLLRQDLLHLASRPASAAEYRHRHVVEQHRQRSSTINQFLQDFGYAVDGFGQRRFHDNPVGQHYDSTATIHHG